MPLWVLPAVPALAAATAWIAGRRAGSRTAARVGAVALLVALLLLVQALAPVISSVGESGAEASVVADAFGTPARVERLYRVIDTGEVSLYATLRLDPLSGVLGVFALLGALAILASMATARPTLPGSVGPVLLGAAALLLLLLSDDAGTLLLAWELGALASWRLAIGDRAGHGITLVSLRLGTVALLVAITLLTWSIGSMQLHVWLQRASSAWLPGHAVPVLVVMLLFVATATRAGIVPFHMGLTSGPMDSTVGVAWQAVGGLLGGAYLLARFAPVLVLGAPALALVAGLGTVTALSTGATALAQNDRPAMVGWSVFAHAGVAMCAVGTGGIGAGVLVAAVSSWFLAAAALLGPSRTGNPGNGRWSGLRPIVVAAVLVAAWVGIPGLTPTVVARTGVAASLVREPMGTASLALAFVLTTVLVAATATRWLIALRRERSGQAPLTGPALLGGMLVLVGVSGLGRIGGPLDRLLAAPVQLATYVRIPDEGTQPVASLLPLLSSMMPMLLLVATGIGVVVTWLLAGPRRDLAGRITGTSWGGAIVRAARGGWYVTEAAEALLARPLASLVRAARGRIGAGRQPWGRWLLAPSVGLLLLAASVALRPPPTPGLTDANPPVLSLWVLLRVSAWVALAGLFPAHRWRLRLAETAPEPVLAVVSLLWVPSAWALLAVEMVRGAGGAPEVARLVAASGAATALLAGLHALAWRSWGQHLAASEVFAVGCAAVAAAAGTAESLLGAALLVLAVGVTAVAARLLSGPPAAAGTGREVGHPGSGRCSAREMLRWCSLLLAGFAPAVGGLLLFLGTFRAAPGATAACLAGMLLLTLAATREPVSAGDPGTAGAPRSGLRSAVAFVLLVALVAGGWAPQPLLEVLRSPVRRLLVRQGPFEPADPEIDLERRVAVRSAEQVAQEEREVGRTFGQPPHEPRIPFAAVADVDAHPVALLGQLALQRASDAVQHLELPAR